MQKVKTFETDNETITFQLVTPTIEGVLQPKELLIHIETPNSKKKDVVMLFSIEKGIEIANEILRQLKQ